MSLSLTNPPPQVTPHTIRVSFALPPHPTTPGADPLQYQYRNGAGSAAKTDRKWTRMSPESRFDCLCPAFFNKADKIRQTHCRNNVQSSSLLMENGRKVRSSIPLDALVEFEGASGGSLGCARTGPKLTGEFVKDSFDHLNSIMRAEESSRYK